MHKDYNSSLAITQLVNHDDIFIIVISTKYKKLVTQLFPTSSKVIFNQLTPVASKFYPLGSVKLVQLSSQKVFINVNTSGIQVLSPSLSEAS